MLDIHIIPNPGFDENLKEVVAALAHPKIAIHLADWVEGNLLTARLAGYAKGTNPYVSWVDGDDRVVSVDWVDRALEILEADPTIAAVYPRWYTSKNGKKLRESPNLEWSLDLHRSFTSIPLAHHLTIMRRPHVLSLLKEAHDAVGCMVKSADRFVISGLVRYGRLVMLEDIAYEWRLRDGTGRSHNENEATVKWVRKRAAQDMQLARLSS